MHQSRNTALSVLLQVAPSFAPPQTLRFGLSCTQVTALGWTSSRCSIYVKVWWKCGQPRHRVSDFLWPTREIMRFTWEFPKLKKNTPRRQPVEASEIEGPLVGCRVQFWALLTVYWQLLLWQFGCSFHGRMNLRGGGRTRASISVFEPGSTLISCRLVQLISDGVSCHHPAGQDVILRSTRDLFFALSRVTDGWTVSKQINKITHVRECYKNCQPWSLDWMSTANSTLERSLRICWCTSITWMYRDVKLLWLTAETFYYVFKRGGGVSLNF